MEIDNSNKNINLEPEIWTYDDSPRNIDQANENVPAEIFDDEEVYAAILNNDIEAFVKLVCNELIDYAAAQEIFIAARRDLEIEDESEDDLDEALTLSQRRQRARVMKRMKSRLKVARRLASRRKASPEKLKARATKAARLVLKKRLAAQRDYKTLTPSEKVAVDRRMERVSQNTIDRIARKLLPQVRKKEVERMASRLSKKNQKNESIENYLEIHTLAENTILYLQEKGQCDLITMAQIKQFEKVVDGLFGKFNIDFKFTKHFAERMSDKRNDPCISLQDLAEFIKKIYSKVKSGKNSLAKYKDVEVVLKDLQQSLNIPAAIEYDRKNDELTVVTKTIMRKKNFSTPNEVVKY